MSLRLLFVCTGNTCRSPLAEGLARQIFGAEAEIRSAGLSAWEGSGATSLAVEAGLELGADLNTHKATPLTGELLDRFDWIIPMTRDQERILVQQFPLLKDRIRRLGAWGDTGEDVVDPWGGSLKTYQASAAQIQRLLIQLREAISKNLHESGD